MANFPTEGQDFIFGTNGDDSIDALGGDDFVRGDDGNDFLQGNTGRDDLSGGAGVDQLNGGPDGDRLFGGSSLDILNGENGSDRLRGGRDVDILSGGSGGDTFEYFFRDESGVRKGVGFDFGDRDLITDFNVIEDRISLNVLDAMQSTAGNQNFTFIGQNGFNDEGQVRFGFEGGNTVVEINTLGASGADMAIDLTGIKNLIGFDFVL